MAGEWRVMSVDDLRAPTENALATGPFGSSIGAKFFAASGVPVIRGSNLSADVGVRLIDEGMVFVPPEKAAEFRRSVARQGDLVFTCWGTVNQVGLIDGRARYAEYIVSNKQMKLTPDPRLADSLFLYYAFSGPEVQASILGQAIGSSVPGFNLGQLRSMRLRLPPLEEQRAIARILGALDDKIELNRRMNETLEQMARALFKSWFVDFDPVRAKAEGRQPEGLDPATAALFPSRLVDSPLGPIPEGWTSARFSAIANINPTRSLRSGEYTSYVGMKALPTSGSCLNSPPVPREFTSGSKFRNGDVLLARITPCLENGKTVLVDFLAEDEVAWGSTEFIVIAPGASGQAFNYCMARSGDFRNHVIRSMTGSSGRQRVANDALDHFFVPHPPRNLLARFETVASQFLRRCTVSWRESMALAEVREVLLPKLISGDLRVG